jgi:hypothetical protein
MHADIPNCAAVIVEQAAVASAFIASAAFFFFAEVGLSMKTVKMGIESIHVEDEVVDLCLGKQIAVIMDGISMFLRTTWSCCTFALGQLFHLRLCLGEGPMTALQRKIGALFVLRLGFAEHKLECFA